jgi:hypothetical protein
MLMLSVRVMPYPPPPPPPLPTKKYFPSKSAAKQLPVAIDGTSIFFDPKRVWFFYIHETVGKPLF